MSIAHPLNGLMHISETIEAGLNPGAVVLRTHADGLPEVFSEHKPRTGDEAGVAAHGDRLLAEERGINILEVVSYDGDTGRARLYTALARVAPGEWFQVASWAPLAVDA